MKISKSRFMGGQQCSRRLWQDFHAPKRKAPTTAADEFLFAQGHEVGALAQKLRGPGTLIELDHRRPGPALEATRQALEASETRLYEAGFEFDGFLAFADIIERLDNGYWRLIEVKATTRAKDVHVPDLAFQAWLMEKNGLPVSEAGVLHLNRDAVWPDEDALLMYSDLSNQVLEHKTTIPGQAGEMAEVAAQAHEPEIAPGRHCNSPYECPYKAHCWQAVPEDDLLVLPRLSLNKEAAFRQRGWHRVSDIQDPSALSETQQIWVETIQSGAPSVDTGAIRAWLEALVYPIHSVDFETISYAVPRWEGMRPYQRVPFQFSCHTEDAAGNRNHREYLHLDRSDPRHTLAIHLLDAAGDTGSIITWNASFEKGVIQELASAFPDLRAGLEALLARVVDLMDVFRKWYFHPGCLGSASIKVVGEAILGENAGYKDLEINKGDQAGALWHEFIFKGGGQSIPEDLRAYCAQDTRLPLDLLTCIRGRI